MNLHAWIDRLENRTWEQVANNYLDLTVSQGKELGSLLELLRDIVSSYSGLKSEGPTFFQS